MADRQRLEVAGFDIVPRDLPHVVMVEGSPGPLNTGFLVDDRFFHPGDDISLNGRRVETLAAPIAGPSMSFRGSHRFVQEVGADRVVPIHSDVFIARPDLFTRFCDIATVLVLKPGESAEA